MKINLFFILFFFSTILIAGVNDSTNSAKKGKNLILPIAVATPETQFGLGVFAGKFFRTDKDTMVRTSSIQFVGLYTLRSQLLLQSGSTVYFPKEKYILNWFGTYSDFPDKFYGIGSDSRKSDETSYSYKQIYLFPQLVRRFYKNFYAGLQYEYQNVLDVNYDAGDIFDQEQVIGRHGSISSGIGPAVLWDSRDNAFSPKRGIYFLVSYKGYGRLTGSQYNFSSYNLDFRKFVHTRGNNVFAFQIVSQITSGTVPFRELPFLGGPYLLRGYYLGRFRDKGMIAFQPEYRFNVWRRFGGVVFAGLGEVTDKFSNLSIGDIKYAGGLGLRYAIIPKDKLNIRVDAALGQDSFGLYFIVMEAF